MVHRAKGCVIAPKIENFPTEEAAIAAWNRRTLAPEGEASLWGCADGNGIDPRLVFRDRPAAEQVAADMNMVVQPLYASPVVPVGSGEADKLAGEIRYQVECSSANLIKSGADKQMVEICLSHFNDLADRVAALRPTDTGGEA
jgi:hypothetical protein